MSRKAGLLLITVLVGSYALEQDLSIFFDDTDAQGRIIGGTVVTESVPYMVGLVIDKDTRTFFCGGSLITERHVLTAAHCIQALFSDGRLLDSLRGIVGTNQWDRGGTTYRFSHNISHPHYVVNTFKNDIAMLATVAVVILSDKVQPVVLHFEFVGAGVATIDNGWGDIYFGGEKSRDLLRLYAVVVDGDRCRDELKQKASSSPIQVEPHIEICTFNATGRGVCNGDSGSALIRSDVNEQIGVGSWGMLCGRGAPDVFARVSAYREWIEQSIES